jgi:HAD superfamily hydrolase (TIGR01509 family)
VSGDPARPVALLLDVDGTLVDSNFLHVVAWSRAFAAVGRPVPMADILRQVGKGADLVVQTLLPGADEALVDDVVDRHAEYFAELHEELRPLPGARDLLQAAADRGLRVVLASSAEAEDHAANLKALEADDLIDDATSSADVDAAKPEPDLFEVARRKADVPTDRALVVGDTVWDVEAAARAGVPCVAVTCGGIGARDLEAAGAVLVLSGPGELAEQLDEVLDRVLGGP